MLVILYFRFWIGEKLSKTLNFVLKITFLCVLIFTPQDYIVRSAMFYAEF